MSSAILRPENLSAPGAASTAPERGQHLCGGAVMAQTRPDRFWAKVALAGPDDCWPWVGGALVRGYGRVYYAGRGRRSHRVAYELLVGPIPEGLVIDHLCRNRACCNPTHLEPVTIAENVRRGLAGDAERRRTHCPQGHPYDEANTQVYQRRRYCRACGLVRQQRRRQRAREQAE